MPVQLNNHTVTDDYDGTSAGGGGARYAYGTLLVFDEPVDVLIYHGVTGGQSSPLEFLSLPPGTYPLFGFDGDYLVELQIKNAVAGNVARVSVYMFEPQRAGLAPSAVINPLASSGIREITSVDGSIVVTNPFGPITDLSVVFGDFLHWGNNFDVNSLGLYLQSHAQVTIQTDGHGFSVDTTGGGGAGDVNLNADIGDLIFHNFWWSLRSNGSASFNLTGPGSFGVTVSNQINLLSIHDILIRANAAAGTGGLITITGDAGVIVDGGGGSSGLILRASSHTGGPTGNIAAELASGKQFIIKNHGGSTILSATDGGAGLDSIDAFAALAMHGSTGVTSPTRYVGGTATGAPASGTWAVGDYIITADGHVYICVIAGTPGTWADVGGGGTGGPAGGVLGGTYPNPVFNPTIAGNALVMSGGNTVIDVNPDNTTIEIAADALRLKDTAVTPGTYGDATHVGQFTVNSKGQITNASNVSIGGALPGSQLDYVQRTTNVTINSTTPIAILTGSSVAYSGTQTIMIYVYTPSLVPPNSTTPHMYIALYEDGTQIGVIMDSVNNLNTVPIATPGYAGFKRTPAAGNHTYSVRGYLSTGTTAGSFGAGAGGSGAGTLSPAYMQILSL